MSEWDDTPWAGTSVSPPAITRLPWDIKAVTGAGVSAFLNDPPLSSLRQMDDPQAKAKAFLQAYKCGWFYKAESKISGDLARLPWTVSDGDVESDDPEETNIPQPDLDIPFETLNPIDQFMRLMERPNPQQTGRMLRQKTHIRRDMAGWTFWYLEAASPLSPITAIYGISPSRLWPSYDKRSGQLLGWILDYDKQGGTMTFEPWEIVTFSNASADDDNTYGVGVVEAVYAELPLTDLMSKHTADLLSTGGRLAGMMWPRERALDEDEFNDAQRAWRNVVSDANSAKRMLLFPEPMEYASGASTPAEIGIPELAELNRDNILTAFPIAPEVLGVSMPAGQNASGETRRELYDWYWRGTIEPRSDSFDEVIQVNIISRYEALMGQTFNFETNLPTSMTPHRYWRRPRRSSRWCLSGSTPRRLSRHSTSTTSSGSAYPTCSTPPSRPRWQHKRQPQRKPSHPQARQRRCRIANPITSMSAKRSCPRRPPRHATTWWSRTTRASASS